jgi:hypothetical protein
MSTPSTRFGSDPRGSHQRIRPVLEGHMRRVYAGTPTSLRITRAADVGVELLQFEQSSRVIH